MWRRADEAAIGADVLAWVQQALTSQATFESGREGGRATDCARAECGGDSVFVEAEAQHIVGAVHDHAATTETTEDLEIGLGIVGADASA